MMQSDASLWKCVPLRRDSQFTTFFHTLSHDLRTPLTQMTGFAELLNLDGSLTADQKEYAAAILSACGELNRAVLAHLRLIETSLCGEDWPNQSGEKALCANQPEQPRGNRDGWQEVPAESAIGSRNTVA